MRTVLVSGAGVAGPTLAFWLARHGFQVTVVERATGQRSSGNPVDVRGPAVPVAERMGILPRLRAAATSVTGMRFVDRNGGVSGRVAIPASAPADLEILRTDLAAILSEAAGDDAEFRYDDTVTTLTEDAGGVDVTFENAAPRRFDVVVGADGLHSTVRRLTFGTDEQFVRHMGVYVGGLPLGEDADHPDEVLMYNTPGRLVAVHPGRGLAMVGFFFRRAAVPGFDHRDADQHRRLLVEAYGADRGWRLPHFLDRVRAAPDLYFDSVSEVALPSWSRGRVTLLGDAAASVSLFGDGSSMAMVGARSLAEALATAAEPAEALRRYEAEHRRRTDSRRHTARLAAAFLIPRTAPGIATRNAAARLLLSRS
jgi:2-polyprenyl-6-methoxyphenol hydroxylase-like FAD-dependent oxidoreductase